MVHHYIPFANSASDWGLVRSQYSEAAGCRVSLQSLKKASQHPRPDCKLWVDANVDGLHRSKVNDPDDDTNATYKQYIRQFEYHDCISDADFQRRPDRAKATAFVDAILDAAYQAVPDAGWLSVPQLPYTDGSERNKINKLLAEIARQWKSSSPYRGKLILPVIFTKQSQTVSKTARNPKVELATACFEASGADGIWVVDSALNDQEGVGSFEHLRFPRLVAFHQELNSKLSAETVTVAGPYWGLNIILWARGLVRLPAIGVGKSFQYHIAGGIQKKPVTRIALPPLRRLAQWSPALKKWLESALRSLPKSDVAHSEFARVLRNFEGLQHDDVARGQVARFYKEWIEKLESVTPSSRALTLYQDFSAAYVLGMGLKPLPSPEKVRNPARIAKQFMVNCL